MVRETRDASSNETHTQKKDDSNRENEIERERDENAEECAVSTCCSNGNVLVMRTRGRAGSDI